MSNCILVTCSDDNGIPSYLGSFNYQNGLIFKNTEMSFDTSGGQVTIPGGTIVIPVPPNPSFISYNGCKSVVSLPVPDGSTQAQITDIVNQVMYLVAQQQAECDAGGGNPAVPPIDGGGGSGSGNPGGGGGGGGGSPATIYYNSAVTKSCSSTPQMKLVGTLPAFVAFSITKLTCAPMAFASYVSQSDANLAADSYLASLIAGGVVLCGWWNEAGSVLCEFTGVTINYAENEFFSTISQDEANQLAIDNAYTLCVCAYVLAGTYVPVPGQFSASYTVDSDNSVHITVPPGTGGRMNFNLGTAPLGQKILVVATNTVDSIAAIDTARLTISGAGGTLSGFVDASRAGTVGTTVASSILVKTTNSVTTCSFDIFLDSIYHTSNGTMQIQFFCVA